jgi:hypothetical protein
MRHRTVGGWVAGLALLLAACSFPMPIPPGSPGPIAKQPLMDEFDRNLAMWQASAITTYAFTYKPMCFCDTTSHLVVAEGDVIRIDGVAAVQQFGAPAGVPGLFEIVRRAINGDSVTVGYDPVTGVPVTMSSDPIKNAVDDELSFAVDGWTLDPPDDRVLGEVTRARGVWQGKSIWTYSMTVKINHEVYEVKVKDGDSTVTQGGRKLRPDDISELPLTVQALFDLAAQSAPNGSTTVTFDAELGYPTSIVIGADPGTAFKGETIKVTKFSVP